MLALKAYCAWCGAVFGARGTWEVVCSPACAERRGAAILRARATRRALAIGRCEVCRDTFDVRTACQRTCGTPCRMERQRELARRRYAAAKVPA